MSKPQKRLVLNIQNFMMHMNTHDSAYFEPFTMKCLLIEEWGSTHTQHYLFKSKRSGREEQLFYEM